MRKIVNRWQFIALTIMLVAATSCDKDDPKQPNPGGKGNILITTTVKNPNGKSGTSYMQLIEKLSGSIDNSKGIPVSFGWPVQAHGNNVFCFPEWGKDGKQQLLKYTKSTAGLAKVAELQLTPNSGAANLSFVNDQKAYLGMFSIGKAWIINPKTMRKLGELDFNKYAYKDKIADPGFGIIRDDLYYVPLGQTNASYMPYKDHLQVDVAIVDTKTDKILKVISETTSKLSFPTRPMLDGMIFMNEQKDIYIACVGFFGYVPGLTETGFVCIPAGKTEFDVSRTWDISKTTIEGTSYKPAAVYNSYYIGKGKLAAYVCVQEFNGDNPYTARNAMAVLIDMNDKTIKKIEGIPLTDGHSITIRKFKDLVAFGAYGKDKVGYFTYNPTSGEVQHALTTVGNPSYLHVFE